MQTFIDQTGHELWMDSPPRRIVSLTPSITELLFDLGLSDEVVGVTRHCSYPEVKTRHKERVGEIKNPDLEKIRSLNPDLILGNKRENLKEVIADLRQDFPVWISDVNSIETACDMIRSIGDLVEKQPVAQWIAGKIEERFRSLASEQVNQKMRRRAVCLVWRKPLMAAGAGTFTNSLLEITGLINAFSTVADYPETTEAEIRTLDTQLILLPTSPFPFNERNVLEMRAACPGASVVLVDGELFGWYGSRLLRTPDYLRALRGTYL